MDLAATGALHPVLSFRRLLMPLRQAGDACAPATAGFSDHKAFAVRGIPYIYFEATNWWAKVSYQEYAYDGYTETYDTELGEGGKF